jgi:hypothetical protein
MHAKQTLQDNGCVLVADRDGITCYELEMVLSGIQKYAVLKSAPATAPSIRLWYYGLDEHGQAQVWPILDPGRRSDAITAFSTHLNSGLFRAP